MSKKSLSVPVLVLSIGLFSCQRNTVVERDITTPPVLQDSQQAEIATQGTSELPPGHPSIDGKTGAGYAAAKIVVKPGEIKKVQGGVTIQEVFTKKDTLNGKSVSVRGKVVKYNSGIMGKNWIHIQDGTGEAGGIDLVVTTKDQASLDQVIVVSGILQYNKNIGSGYVFPAIIEDAALKP